MEDYEQNENRLASARIHPVQLLLFWGIWALSMNDRFLWHLDFLFAVYFFMLGFFSEYLLTLANCDIIFSD